MKYQLLFIILLFIQKYGASIICNHGKVANANDHCTGNYCYYSRIGEDRDMGCGTENGYCHNFKRIHRTGVCCTCNFEGCNTDLKHFDCNIPDK
ncbi:hypothetical protein Mgra_00009437 [Meloidogyne graminicola]|uniref:Uncharacterized protein n=1 Tax=Meloidogyne graminicola TaxID=189291 RepID=A0A8S9ZBP2_9BILA|nr:hypothetical protein Mgra_00009437 [Meloidogyne graminicola]